MCCQREDDTVLAGVGVRDGGHEFGRRENWASDCGQSVSLIVKNSRNLLGLNEYGRIASTTLYLGISSMRAIAVAVVPPDTPPFNLYNV